MSTLVTIVHVLVCIFLMLTVLLQSGKGGGMGAAFGGGGGGGGGSGTVFGGSGAGGVLRKATVVVAALFMLTSMTLAWISSNTGADALRRYSAQQRRAAEVKAAKRDEALKDSVAPDAPDVEDPGAGSGPDTDVLVPPASDGEQDVDGTEADSTDTDEPTGEAASPDEASSSEPAQPERANEPEQANEPERANEPEPADDPAPADQ